MVVAKIKVDGVCAVAEYRKLIPAGIIGAQVLLDYADDIWQGLRKTVVFRGAATKDVITDDEVVTIPAEVVAKPNVALKVGVYGVDAYGNLAIPTLWADLGTVRSAADPEMDITADPSLPVWAQLRAMIGDLDALDTEAKENLVAAVNEAMTKGGSSVDGAEIQRIVDAYLAANPPQVTETDPTVPDWAKQPQKPTYTAPEVGADPAGTAATAVSQHNTDTAAHNDLRIALQGLSDRVNAALDSDDTTLDQMSEVVAYIKSNKSLIDAITTSKVSVADIVNDLVTNVADKPLSAAQGVVLKGLIDELQSMIPETYTLPMATETTLGGVKPVTATDAMTQPVGVAADGRLVTKPGEGGGISVTGATVGQTVKIAAVDDDGVPTAWEAVDFPDGSGGTKTEEATVNISVGTESVTLDETAPEQTVNLAWNVPGSKVIPSFTNYYIAKSNISYPRAFDTSYYTQFWSSNNSHGNADAYVSGHQYLQVFHYVMDGDSAATISSGGNATHITPTNSATISGSGWAYTLATPNSTGSTAFMLGNTSTGTGTIDYLYCIDVTALQEAGTITATTISELAELFGELPLIPGQDFEGATTSGEAILSITRDGDVTEISLGTATASVKGGDILVMDTGSVTFVLTILKTVTDSEQTVYSIYPDWSEWTWIVVGDSLTDETINATKKYYRYIAEKTGINVIVVGQGGTGYARDNSNTHADATNMYYQRCANLANLVINSGGDTSKVIVSVFGSINDWCVTNPYDGRFIGGDTYTTVDDAIGSGTDTWNEDGDNTLCAHMRHCYEVIYEQLPLCKLFVVNHLFYAGIPNQESRIVKPLTDVCETMRIKHFDLYHNCSYPIDTNQEFATRYTTDAPADIASATNSYGHPSNEFHDEMLAPYFYKCLQEVMPLA